MWIFNDIQHFQIYFTAFFLQTEYPLRHERWGSIVEKDTELRARLPEYKPPLCHLLVVLVVYCCITKHHKSSGWKQCTFIFSQFLWIRDPGELSWVIGLVYLTRLQSRCWTRVGVSAEVSAGEGCASKPPWLLAGLSSLWADGWRLLSVSCCVGLSNMAACFLQSSKGASLLTWQKSQSYIG